MLTLYNVISSDGFIAGKDGDEDFIPDTLWQGFLSLCKEYGTLIMGRKSYDAIQTYDDELLQPFENLSIKKIVISSNKKFSPKNGYIVLHSPKEVMELAPDALVCSGPTLNNSLLKSGFVKKILLYEVPTSIGEGIKPFDKEGIALLPEDKTIIQGGVTIHEYRIE